MGWGLTGAALPAEEPAGEWGSPVLSCTASSQFGPRDIPKREVSLCLLDEEKRSCRRSRLGKIFRILQSLHLSSLCHGDLPHSPVHTVPTSLQLT